ncbi:MAG: PepSY-associated TM helix domain-containing protein [Mycobacterium sp.]
MTESPTPRRTTRRRRGTASRVRRILVLSHRWIGLLLGVLVVIVSTSGALLVFQPELVRALNSEMFRTTFTEEPIGFAQAITTVETRYPEIHVASASLKDGVYFLRASTGTHDTFFIDAGTGRLNGRTNLGDGVLGFLTNLHDCGLTCEGYSGHVPFLTQPSPLASLDTFSGLSWGAALLTLAALILLLLVIPAPFIWWKAIRKLGNAVRLRWRSGRFARDFDIHAIVGIVATLPLLIWALTGLQFEVPGFSDLWYSLTGGQSSERDFPATNNAGHSIAVDEAMTLALKHFPQSEVTWIGMPDDSQPFYRVDLLDGSGPDLRAYGTTYHGNRSVGIDAHDPDHIQVFQGQPPTASNAIADEWAGPAAHFGLAVNIYWRTLWFILGMAPLILAATGLSTWHWRRRTRQRRKSELGARNTGPRADAPPT